MHQPPCGRTASLITVSPVPGKLLITLSWRLIYGLGHCCYTDGFVVNGIPLSSLKQAWLLYTCTCTCITVAQRTMRFGTRFLDLSKISMWHFTNMYCGPLDARTHVHTTGHRDGYGINFQGFPLYSYNISSVVWDHRMSYMYVETSNKKSHNTPTRMGTEPNSTTINGRLGKPLIFPLYYTS